jgi:hypothetical protein
MQYLHTQRVPNNVMTIAALAVVGVAFAAPTIMMRLTFLAVLGATAVAFRSVTVTVDDKRVSLSFGPGLIKKSFQLVDIASARAMRTTPLQGWGIHWTGVGWLYNVYGLDAVELCFKNGKHVFIGTDEPEKLATFINESLKYRE